MTFTKLMLVLSVLILFLLGHKHVQPTIMEAAGFLPLVLTYMGWILDQLFIMNWSQDMDRVDKFIKRRKDKSPIISAFLNWCEGYPELALNDLERLRPSSRKEELMLHFTISLHEKHRDYESAKKEIEKIKDCNERCFDLAIIALLERDWKLFNELKQMVKQPMLKSMLEINEALIQGDIKKAHQSRDLLLTRLSGFRKYLLVKWLEHNPNEPLMFIY